jgi:DNA-binding XRE family transcriptional regulator
MIRKKKTTRKAARGRPKIAITPAMIRKVELLASKGLTKEQIAISLGFCRDTLREKEKEYSDFSGAIKKGQAKGLETITNALFQAAKNGNTTAQIFFLKNRDPDNWSDRRVNENIERKENDELGRITEEEAIRVAKNVILAAELNDKARRELQEPSIDDEPVGSA